jgi:hypothetical protein
MYFINDYHEQLFRQYMEKLGFPADHYDPEYTAFSYLMGATQKKSGLKYCDAEGISVGGLKEDMEVWSTGERAFGRLAMQLFNSRMDDITTYEVFYNLSDDWAKAAVQGIKIRYKLGVER